MDQIRKTIDGMRGEEDALLKTRSDEAKASARSASLTIVFGTLAAFIVLAVASFAITRNIANPLKEISATAERISAGDLSASTSIADRDDEVGILARTSGFAHDDGLAESHGRRGRKDRRRRPSGKNPAAVG